MKTTERNLRIAIHRLFVLRILLLIGFPFVLVSCVGQSAKVAPQKRSKPSQPAKVEILKKDKKLTHLKRITKQDYLRKIEEIRDPKIVIYKSKRQLFVIDGDTIVRKYPIALGKNPKGDKTLQGDGKTPEGAYRVCIKNSRSRFYKSIGINYPTIHHAEKAFVNGLITAEEYKRIILANEQGRTPPWNTKLGGAIFIHGGGAYADWTDGCVALYNTDMDELYRIVKIGTPVYIFP